MAAVYGAGGVVLPRTSFEVSRKGERGRAGRVPRMREFSLPVEQGADELVAFISGRNGNMATWGIEPELISPDGT